MKIPTAIDLMVLLVIALLLVGVTIARSQPACMTAETRDRVRMLMLDGIDAGLKAHAQHMFEVWMKDPSKQPQRAHVGMRLAINAYVGSRATAQRWSPPTCER